jgi:hypothetical protein
MSAFRKRFEMQSNSQYDRVSPSFFGDRRLDGLLYPVLAGIVGRYFGCLPELLLLRG